MTLLRSGIYFLPESKKNLYHAPHHRVGATDINFLTDESVHATIKGIGESWTEGHERSALTSTGTSVGRRVGRRGRRATGRGQRSTRRAFVANWRTNTGFHDLPSLPFDYDKERIGGRTPCLEGGDNLRT